MKDKLKIEIELVSDEVDDLSIGEKIVTTKKSLEIIKAEYGFGGKFKDVTKKLQSLVKNSRLKLEGFNYNQNFGDPIYGVVKQLRIKYVLNGRTAEISFIENASILIPRKRIKV